MNPAFYRPQSLLAGFGAYKPEAAVPELWELGEQWATPKMPIDWHRNAGWELYLQVEGTSVWESSGGEFTVPPAGAYIIGPRVRHRLRRFVGSRTHFYFAVVELPEAMRVMGLESAAWRPGLVWTCPDGRSLRPSFEALVREAVTARAHRAAALRLHITALILEATRLLEGATRGDQLVPTHAAAARARTLLEEQPGRPWRLPELARLVGLSPNHLSEVFRREFGLPPHRYLLRLRLERAAILLKSGQWSVTQAALELGFASGQHFARHFRRRFGHAARQLLPLK